MDKVLIDTDVILDFLFDRKPFSEDAAQILSWCENSKIQGFVTSIVLSNIYYLLRKTAKHEKVIENLKMLLNIVDVITTNKDAVLDALHSQFKDFEDALQNFSAQNSNEIKVIITRNSKDYKTSNLAVMEPETYIKLVKI
ncbi:PIN domain-containing protein [Chryseobacterium manosquense]|uniref:PIN domain-containing protein n=1 Tax=Chryseobacterium manosquense TaxID=2754694 RepID=A0A7H1DTC3_9FLAO|nr:PIN domain-containing protein [Chryseobacterium manosquense]QNS40231.1 PIN domain-containing protein [Chryseobacterium manosquense]